MPEPFRCETCEYGRWSLLDNDWSCLVGCSDDEDMCLEAYEESGDA